MASKPVALHATAVNLSAIPFPDAGIAAPPIPAIRSSLRQSILSLRNRLGQAINRAGLQDEEFTVLSNDCWGQALYEGYGLPCRTPLVGSGMHADCFLRFLGNIEGYLRSPLHFVPGTRYPAVRRLRGQRGSWPVALLGRDLPGGAVEIHFLHYRAEDEARRVWDLGCDKLNLKRIAVKFSTGKDGATQQHVDRFAQLPFERKLLLTRNPLPHVACAVETPDYVINGAVMFRRSLKYFDCTHWLNTGQIRRAGPRVLASKAIYIRGV